MSRVEPHPSARSGDFARQLLALTGVAIAVICEVVSGCTDEVDEHADDSMLLELLEDDRTLDGSHNNRGDPMRGAADQPFARVTDAVYTDGISAIDADRPAERYMSNRVFNDTDLELFSENGISHWGFVWGQFIDHTISLSVAGGDEDDNPINDFGLDGIIAMRWIPEDPLEISPNAQGIAHTFRSETVPGTGSGAALPAAQINKLNSYIDAFNVYGGTAERLDWLRAGPAEGDPSNNSAELLTEDGYLPTAMSRPEVEMPHMDLPGRLRYDPSPAVVAGDERANENVGLTAVHTLFVREHNRLVQLLPDTLDSETKFAIVRRVIAATEQFITYEEFLPAMGIDLGDYAGYDPTVDATITNEFATVGFRAHSQIPDSLIADMPAEEVTDELLARFAADGVDVADLGAAFRITIPHNVAFANPALVADIGLGNLAAGLAREVQRANDELIDDQMRTVLFQIPDPGVENPLECLDEAKIDSCFLKVIDLGGLDVFRAYDHGIAPYNDLRTAYGLDSVVSFTEITGEETDELPDGLTIDDPEILDVVDLVHVRGLPVAAVRRSTLAARLAAIFTNVDRVDAFTGMVSEQRIPGTEFGELQFAIWTEQFRALRDGDRFFYANDPALGLILELYGIDYRRTLGEVIADNTAISRADLASSVFLVEEAR
jgi:hypothetical protein